MKTLDYKTYYSLLNHIDLVQIKFEIDYDLDTLRDIDFYIELLQDMLDNYIISDYTYYFDIQSRLLKLKDRLNTYKLVV